jgi:hypothetical protein
MLNPPTPLPECPDANYTACDVREPDCQSSIVALAACIRDSEPLTVPIEVLTESDYTALLQAEAEDEPEAEIKHFQRALAWLELAPEQTTTRDEEIDHHVTSVLGVYRPAEKRIIIVDHGKPADTPYIDATLLHEAVHALQDADYDLTTWPGEPAETFDARLARNAVVEGEADFYEYRAVAALLGLDVAQVDFESALLEHLDFVQARLSESTAPYRDSYATFPYGFGALQAFHAWQEGGPRGTDAIWASPPGTTQQLMAQQLGLNEPQATPRELPLPEIEGLTLYASDVLGAWGLHLVLGMDGVSNPAERALDWRGDRLRVFTDTDNQPYLLWQLELASEDAARLLTRTRAGCTGRSFATRAFVSCGDHQVRDELTSWADAWLSSE